MSGDYLTVQCGNMKEINISTKRRTDFVDCTSRISEAVSGWDMQSGVVNVFVPHTTAGVTINENADPDVMADIEGILDKLVPWRDGYRHAEGNAAAHMKASIVGSSVQIIVENARLKLGTWQGVYFCEFDGPRRRRIWIAER